MAAKDCIDAIKKASGREMTTEEAAEIYEALEKRIRRDLKAGMSRADAARKNGAELSEELTLAAALEKRTAKFNAIAWEQLGSRYVEGREADALQALVSGFAGARGRSGAFRDAGSSISAQGIAAKERALGGLVGDLERTGLLQAVKRRNAAFERDIVREMGRIDNPDLPGTGNKHAEQAAAIFSKHLDGARLAQNEAGAWIGKMDNYLGRQSHDAYRIREAGFEQWRNDIQPRLRDDVFADAESPAEVRTSLYETWKSLGDGIHDQPNADWMGYQGVGSLAKRVSQKRVLHFKDADAWMEYNALYGQGTVIDAVMHGIMQGQTNAAVMRNLGTNPSNMFDRLAREYAQRAHDRGDVAQADRVMREMGPNSRVLDRAMNRPIPVENTNAAWWVQLIRNIQSFKLGGMLFSSFSDTANIMATARHNDIPVLEAFGRAVGSLLPQSAERRELAREMGFLIEGFQASMSNRFMTVDGPAGAMASLNNLFYKLTGQNYWTEHLKEGVGYMVVRRMGQVSNREFSGLSDLHQTTLRRYGIEEGEWNAIRQAAGRVVDNDRVLAPMDIMNLTDEKVAHLTTGAMHFPKVAKDHVRFYHGGKPDGVTGPLWFTTNLADAEGWAGRGKDMGIWFVDVPRGATGVDWGDPANGIIMSSRQELPADIASGRKKPSMSGRNADLVRRDLYDKYSTYAIDQSREAMNEPTARVRDIMTGGSAPAGSVGGETMRTLLQFKSFMITNLVRNLAREVYRDGVNIPGVAMTVAGAAIFGYLSIQMKLLAAGKVQQAPETAGDYSKIVFASLAQGGGLGLLGDFLFGESNRFGKGWESTIGGPTVGMAGDLYDVLAAIREGDSQRSAAEAVKFAKQLPPVSMLNLFYTKHAMDYLIFWRLQEAINPGYLRRYERGIERNNKQKYFWLSPTEAAR